MVQVCVPNGAELLSPNGADELLVMSCWFKRAEAKCIQRYGCNN